ncbi:MAG: recombination mediator RecR [Mycoplasmataceae bacterium]|jgi:recombination protein RecR|nr:recombination mediator RecR [Mycoplasmataceae bacterium]
MNSRFIRLVEAFKTLPGVSTKQARTIAYYLLQQDQFFLDRLTNEMQNAKTHIKACVECNYLCEDNERCQYCRDPKRDQRQLCIVTIDSDVDKIEATNSYFGRYFVLRNELKPNKQDMIDHACFHQLLSLIRKNQVHEVIIATNWTTAGELTATYIKNLINEYDPKINIFRLAVGLPINSALDYADNTTITYAIKNKTKY